MTPFETALEQAKNGTLKTPIVNVGVTEIDYFGYQLSVHKMNLSLMAKGMNSRIKLTDIKKYYGLKGRTAKDCLPQLIEIFDEYKEKLKN